MTDAQIAGLIWLTTLSKLENAHLMLKVVLHNKKKNQQVYLK